jgi:hypothetical protein
MVRKDRNKKVDIKDVKELPPLVRGGGKRASEETRQLQDLLKSCKPKAIENIAEGKQYNALSQRIRTAAKNIGMAVEIRYRKDEQTLYFQGKTTDAKVDEMIEAEAKKSTRRR